MTREEWEKILPNLEDLDCTWGNQKIGSEGLNEIQGLLKTNKTIKRIKLDFNSLGDQGAEIIGDIIGTNQTMTSVTLSANNIGDEGAKKIADGIEKNQTMTSVALSKNNIEDEGARAIAESLKQNSNLIFLDLSRNKIGSEGANHLIEALKTNPFLLVLKMKSPEVNLTIRNANYPDNNGVTEQQLGEIKKLIKQNQEMVPTIAKKYSDKGDEAQFTPKEIKFISNPKNAAQVEDYLKNFDQTNSKEEFPSFDELYNSLPNDVSSAKNPGFDSLKKLVPDLKKEDFTPANSRKRIFEPKTNNKANQYSQSPSAAVSSAFSRPASSTTTQNTNDGTQNPPSGRGGRGSA